MITIGTVPLVLRGEGVNDKLLPTVTVVEEIARQGVNSTPRRPSDANSGDRDQPVEGDGQTKVENRAEPHSRNSWN